MRQSFFRFLKLFLLFFTINILTNFYFKSTLNILTAFSVALGVSLGIVYLSPLFFFFF